jgi:RES domain-containing protein
MHIYRITKKKYSNELISSGLSNRWNEEGEEVIYAAQTRSLACLENLVHRSGIMRVETYCAVIINVPDHLLMEEINLEDLPEGWNLAQNKTCHELGSSWYSSNNSAILKVPSAVIPEEFNYVLNMRHSDFKKIKGIKTVPFYFDKRLFSESIENT